ncbi:unnamed protein product [Didymodactylos carnosus]|uniref:Uncharacterized protein n=1 Tax=Didymodactylos carnosus TaxID=1234261 RepID=A0A814D7I6_9BILA|nr:unnamed protein product [Didymodactylos carnosus]CAF1567000.1 unnamed protein product [Didymodactylos carnosus]CAF3727699.1 unnamed protein product [Didymodactylos carnosus]CAF4360392.1 unnamed protein product [Didymodactylos carnosus]
MCGEVNNLFVKKMVIIQQDLDKAQKRNVTGPVEAVTKAMHVVRGVIRYDVDHRGLTSLTFHPKHLFHDE